MKTSGSLIAKAAFVLLVLVAAMTVLRPDDSAQDSDPAFSAHVERPAFTGRHPRVGIDAGHRNVNTLSGRYKPLRDLLESDGFAVSAAPPFEAAALAGLDILIIANANASGSGSKDQSAGPAFTRRECDAVLAWVRDGGSLLLIADHAPFGDAAAGMAERFGVVMGRGYVMDSRNALGDATWLVFSADNGLLGRHPIVDGRGPAERVRRVVTFTGQSVGVPENAIALLKLSPTAAEGANVLDRFLVEAGFRAGAPVAGRAQGIVMPLGRGRVAVFGEAAMFSAQVVPHYGIPEKVGMNAAGNDDRQFVLNVVHWLARLID